MKSRLILLGLFLTFFHYNTFAQHYIPVDQSSAIKFKVAHQMIFKSTVTGTFSGLQGTIIFEPQHPEQSAFDVFVKTETISSGIGMRDNHLKKDEFFDAQKYPLIVIKSQSISKSSNEDTFIFSGTLTMKGVTKSISFPFTAKPINDEYEFKGSFTLNRLEYNIGSDNSIDKNVEVDLDVIAK